MGAPAGRHLAVNLKHTVSDQRLTTRQSGGDVGHLCGNTSGAGPGLAGGDSQIYVFHHSQNLFLRLFLIPVLSSPK